MRNQIVSADEDGLMPANGCGLERQGAVQADAEPADLSGPDSWRNSRASPELQAIAANYGIRAANCAETELFERIYDHLSQPGREHDLASWFAYRVYRSLEGGVDDSPVHGPGDPLIQAVSRQLGADPLFIDSIRRYRGGDLMWFGRRTAPDGTTHRGGSTWTTAYRRAAQILRPFALSEKRAHMAREAEVAGTAATGPARWLRNWLADAEQVIGDETAVTLGVWHIAAIVLLSLLLVLLFFGR